MRAAADDRVVADVVAHRAGAAVEGALDPALAELEHLVPLAHRVLEAERGDVAGLLELADLPVVLDQPQLGDDAAEFVVEGVVGGDHPVHRGETPRSTRVLAEAGQRVLEPVDVAAPRAEGGRTPGARAAADPQLAVLAVAEELVGVCAERGRA